MNKKGEGRSFTISIGIFQSHSAVKICRGTFQGFRKFLICKKLMSNEGGGRNFHNFTLEILVSQCRKTSCGKHLFQRKSGTEKQIWISGGGITFFRRKFFGSHRRKRSREPFNVSESFWYAKTLCVTRREGETFTILHGKNLVSQCQKSSWGNPSVVPKIGVLKNFMHNRGLHKFLTKFLCGTLPKNFVGNPSVFQKVSGMEKSYE